MEVATPDPAGAAGKAARGGFVGAVYLRSQQLIHEMAKFGIVGAVNAVIDIGLFNILLAGALHKHPLTAKGISMSVATTSSYFMNRHWSFRHRARSGLQREYVLFFVLNGVGLVIAETCLAISHYGFDFHSKLADNLAANVIGLGLGTIFRFWSYRRWVFLAQPGTTEAPAA